MKNKKLWILAGALTTIAACTDDPNLNYPDKQMTLKFSEVPAALTAAPGKETAVTFAVKRYGEESGQAIALNITAEWVTGDSATDVNKGDIIASIEGETLADAGSKAIKRVEYLADAESLSFEVKAQSRNRPLRNGDAAQLSITIADANTNTFYTKVRLIIRGTSPLIKAAEFVMIDGRRNTTDAAGNNPPRPDTLWFGINPKYYADEDPNINRYVVESKHWAKGTAGRDIPFITGSGFFNADKNAVGIEIPTAERDGWTIGDTLIFRVRSTAEQGEGVTSINDTMVCKFVVKSDKLAGERKYNFEGRGKYYALLANKELPSERAAIEASAKDVVLHIDTTLSRTDSTFVLTMFPSTNLERCNIAVEPSSKEAYDAAKRYVVQDTMETRIGGADITLPAPDVHIGISNSVYYAVKIEAYKEVTIGGEKVEVPVTYYGYLKLRTHMAASVGDTPKFSKVELVFKYGEARDYTKE